MVLRLALRGRRHRGRGGVPLPPARRARGSQRAAPDGRDACPHRARACGRYGRGPRAPSLRAGGADRHKRSLTDPLDEQANLPTSSLLDRPAVAWCPPRRLGETNVPAAHRVRGGVMSTTEYDRTIFLEDKPGTLAKAAEAIAAERINIEGGATINCGGGGIFHAPLQNERGEGDVPRRLRAVGV